MFSFLNSFDFWRVFIALWLEYFILVLVIKEQERVKLIPYQMKMETEIKKEINKIFNSQSIINIRKQITEQVEKLNNIKEKVEEMSNASNISGW